MPATTFGKPQRTLSTVFVPIEGPRIRLDFNDISHISIRPSARNPGGFMLSARFPADTWAGEQLEVIDAEALAATLLSNKAWFKNTLGEDQIHEFFDPAIEIASKFAKAVFHVSPTSPPQLGEFGTIDEFYEYWSNAPRRGPHAITATAKVDVVGILFEKQRFRLRLMLRALEIQSAMPAPIEAADLVPDRREIEEQWRAEIETRFNPQIAEQEALLQKIRAVKQDLLRQLEKAEGVQDGGPAWDAHLASIAQTLRDGVWNYLI